MVSKDTIEEILSISEDGISDSVYLWAQKRFFILTGLRETEVSKTFRKFVNTTTVYIKLPNRNIKSIDTLTVDNEPQDFTLFTDLKFNPDTGLVSYTGGFGGGQLVEVAYTLNSYVHEDIHDYLVSLLVTKAISIFTPDQLNQVRMIKIGKFQKQFGSASANLNEYLRVLDAEIDSAIDLINDDDGRLTMDIAN